jgi:hypothetical protein
VRQAVRFCNPVEKLDRNRIVPISNTNGHLKTTNQFGFEPQLAVRDADLLCVPSKKLAVPVIQ